MYLTGFPYSGVLNAQGDGTAQRINKPDLPGNSDDLSPFSLWKKTWMRVSCGITPGVNYPSTAGEGLKSTALGLPGNPLVTL
jgi:hypothetical protein